MFLSPWLSQENLNTKTYFNFFQESRKIFYIFFITKQPIKECSTLDILLEEDSK